MAIAVAIILPIGLLFLLSGLIINFIQVYPYHPYSNFFFELDPSLLLLLVNVFCLCSWVRLFFFSADLFDACYGFCIFDLNCSFYAYIVYWNVGFLNFWFSFCPY